MSFGLDLGPLDATDEPKRLATPDEMRRMLELAAVMLALNPAFVLFRPKAESEATSFGVDVETARQQCSHLQLDDRAASIQLLLFPKEAGVSLSSSKDARRTMQTVWACLREIERRAGYVTYDPQLGGERVDLERDFERVLRSYGGPGVGTAHDTPTLAPHADWPSGTRVTHAKFGVGAVVSAEGAGPSAKLTILFASGETKRLVASAGLTRA